MTSKSPRLMRFIKWGAGIVVVGLWIVIGLAAWGLGFRIPSHHKVRQHNIPDAIFVRAETFLNNSEYAVAVNYSTCCSERISCKGPGGTLYDQVLFPITAKSPIVKIPLRWASRSVCPWEFSYLEIGFAGKMEQHLSFAIFHDSLPPPLLKPLQMNCAQYLDPSVLSNEVEVESIPAECRSGRILYIPLNKLDTLTIRAAL